MAVSPMEVEPTEHPNPLQKVLERAAGKSKGGRPKGRRDSRPRRKSGASHASAVTAQGKQEPTLVSAAKGIAEAARGVGNLTTVPKETDWTRFLGKVLEYMDIGYVSAITGDDEALGDSIVLSNEDCRTVVSPFARRIVGTAFNRKYGKAILSWEQDVDALVILGTHIYETAPLLRERLAHQSLVRESRRSKPSTQMEVNNVTSRSSQEGATEQQPASVGGDGLPGVAPGVEFSAFRAD